MRRLLSWLKKRDTKQSKDDYDVGKKLIPSIFSPYVEEAEITPVGEDSQLNRHLFSILLTDRTRYVQLITTEHRILDINAVHEQEGDGWAPMSISAEHELLRSFGLRRPPIFPILSGFNTWVDMAVFEVNHPLIEMNTPGHWYGVDKAVVSRVVSDYKYLESITVPRPSSDVLTPTSKMDSNNVLAASRLFVKQRLKDHQELPTLPEPTRRLLAIRDNPNSTIVDLAEVVEQDPTMLAMIYRLARSPLFLGKSEDVLSVKDTISRILGYDVTLNLLMGVMFSRVLKTATKEPETPLTQWGESLAVAQLCQELAVLVGGLNPYTAYLAGLLHNFGFRVIQHVFPPFFERMLLVWGANRHIDPVYIDYYMLGVTRDDAAAVLFDTWNLPKDVILAVQGQNRLNYESEQATYARLIRLARRLLSQEGYLFPSVEVEADILERVGLSTEQLDKAISGFERKLHRIKLLVDVVR